MKPHRPPPKSSPFRGKPNSREGLGRKNVFMSTNQTNRLKYLLDQFAANSLTEAEFDELFMLIGQGENENEIKAALAADLDAQKPGRYDRLYWAEKFKKTVSLEEFPLLRQTQGQDDKVRRMFPLRRVVVAASIILALGVGSYFIFNTLRQAQSDKQQVTNNQQQDIKAPEANRAMITLANGGKVFLDEVANGELVQQSNVIVTKTADGKIVYSQESVVGSREIQYNTLTNPRGSKVIDMTLSDGSRVWLNAGSSVTYPVAFVVDERKINITGEAYFEISPHLLKGGKKMPFIVSKGDMEVTVLGTHFNVNAYDDEADIKVTLLEGSVKVSNGSASDFLKPGQQAQITTAIKVVNAVVVEQVVAWKNGLFQFNRGSLQEVMRQIARWYDVDVTYEGIIPERQFGGKINRDANASQVLKILEESKVNFRIEGKKIFVMK